MSPQASYHFDLESESEPLIDLGDAGRVLASLQGRPRPPHLNQVRRWVRTGVRGARLPSVLVAGQRMTSRRAIAWWIAATTAAAEAALGSGVPIGMPTSGGDEAVLRRAGILS